MQGRNLSGDQRPETLATALARTLAAIDAANIAAIEVAIVVAIAALVFTGAEVATAATPKGPTIVIPGPRSAQPRAAVSGFPLPRGIDLDSHEVLVQSPNGAAVDSACRRAFDAPGGEVGRRWVHLEFSGRPGRAYRIRFRPSGRPTRSHGSPPPRPRSRIDLTTPQLALRFDASAGPLPFAVEHEDRLIFGSTGSIDILVERDDGVVRLSGQPARSVRLEQAGPSRRVIVVDGLVRDPATATPWLQYRIRVGVLPRESTLTIDARLSFDRTAAGPAAGSERVSLVLRPFGGKARVVRAPSLQKAVSMADDGVVELRSESTADLSLRIDGEPITGAQRRDAWMSLEDATTRVHLAMPWFRQRHPKSLRARDGCLELAWLEDTSTVGGSARQFEAVLRFSSTRESIERLARLPARAPVRVPADHEWYRRHMPHSPLVGQEDRALARLYDRVAGRLAAQHLVEREEASALGERHFGDWPMFGGWGNLEFDTSFGMIRQFYRDGSRHWLERSREGVAHWVDIDRFPDSAYRCAGLPRKHGVDHGSRFDIGHIWLDGALHDYLLGADLFTRDAFLAAAAGLLTLLDESPDVVDLRERNCGWALAALVAVYEATGDQRAAKLGQRLVANLRRRLHARLDLPAFDGATRAETRTGYRVAPWVTAGVLLPALERARASGMAPEIRPTIDRLATAICRHAVTPGPGIRASIVFRHDGTIVEEGPFLLGDWALFAAGGLALAGRQSRSRALTRAASTLAGDALLDLDRRNPRLDGRARSRILRNGPLALLRPAR